jgi:hypothetical protein
VNDELKRMIGQSTAEFTAFQCLFLETETTRHQQKKNTRAARKVSSHFEYRENRSRGLDVTWEPEET